MTTEEQQPINAAMNFLERQVGNLASEGSNAAAHAEALAMRLKAMTEERDRLQAELAALKPKQDSNVVPITEPAG